MLFSVIKISKLYTLAFRASQLPSKHMFEEQDTSAIVAKMASIHRPGRRHAARILAHEVAMEGGVVVPLLPDPRKEVRL